MMFENSASSASAALNQSLSRDAAADGNLPLLDTQLTPLSAAEKGTGGVGGGGGGSGSGGSALLSRTGGDGADSSSADEGLRFEAWFQHALLV